MGWIITYLGAAGLEQGAYPFGICIRMDGERVFQIFGVLLDACIAERTGK